MKTLRNDDPKRFWNHLNFEVRPTELLTVYLTRWLGLEVHGCSSKPEQVHTVRARVTTKPGQPQKGKQSWAAWNLDVVTHVKETVRGVSLRTNGEAPAIGWPYLHCKDNRGELNFGHAIKLRAAGPAV